MNSRKIALINGVNLDRLGVREPDIYGKITLGDIVAALRSEASTLGVELIDFQSNYEGALVEKISELSDSGVKYAIINPGAFTHTSVALRDSIAGSGMKFVEVHLSNIYAREDFRHTSLTAPVCVGVISGFGFDGYSMALRHISKLM